MKNHFIIPVESTEENTKTILRSRLHDVPLNFVDVSILGNDNDKFVLDLTIGFRNGKTADIRAMANEEALNDLTSGDAISLLGVLDELFWDMVILIETRSLNNKPEIHQGVPLHAKKLM